MKRLTLIALTVGLPLAIVAAPTTLFYDDFSSDTTANYLNGQSGGTMSYNSDTTGFGNPAMQLTTTTSGKLTDMTAAFPAFTLAHYGDAVQLSVDFESDTIGTSSSGLAGMLVYALDNSEGVGPLSSGTTENIASGAAGGPTSGYLGYSQVLAFNQSPKVTTKFYAKTGPGKNDLSYPANMSVAQQLATSVANANEANLGNFHNYTLTFTVMALNDGASHMQISGSLFDHFSSTTVDAFSIGATNTAADQVWNTPTTTFDILNFGEHSGADTAGYLINVNGIQVIAIPEPNSIALFCGGMGLWFMIRRFRR